MLKKIRGFLSTEKENGINLYKVNAESENDGTAELIFGEETIEEALKVAKSMLAEGYYITGINKVDSF